MFLRELDHVRDLLDSVNGVFVGVGMTAFPRIIPAYFLDSYFIVAFRKTGDLPLLRKKAGVFCLEEETGGSLPENIANSAQLLAHKAVKNYLNKLSDPKFLLPYQNYPELEMLARKEGWVTLANPADLRLKLRERAFFQRMGAKIGLHQVPGAIWPIEVIRERSYQEWAGSLGPEMVIQLPDIGQGGGRGTFFVRSAEGYHLLEERLRQGAWRDVRLQSVSVRKFIEGVPVSMAICITRHGILVSRLQKQLVDLPYCRDFMEDGIFCGHVWDETAWPSAIQEGALKQAKRIGEYVSSLGYRGILGIDFIGDERGREIYPIEINPRLTGAFPMLSLLHLEKGIIPLEIFHMLEFLDLPYRIDVEE
ncbi:MAG: ATP-grasp domain-containing protein, partial [Proteobacteria bacterium]|nr:ATP-grasp domain-containing protein [Pseudomonadota bacterium]